MTKGPILDSFEKRYVGFYRWLIFFTGVISLFSFLIFCLVLLWSLSGTSSQPVQKYLSSPQWSQIRGSLLPLTSVEKESTETSEPAGKKEQVIRLDPRILEIRANLLKQFSEEEIETVKLNFSRRILNQKLLVDIYVPPRIKDRYLGDLVSVSNLIGADGRINRISNLSARAELILTALDSYISIYLKNIDRAEDKVAAEKSEAEARKSLALTASAIAIPVSAALFLSIIVLILFIRIELHARNFSEDFRRSISLGE